MPGQGGRASTGWVTGVAGLLACVLLAAVGVAALRSDTASADTVLERGADAVLELDDGTRRAAVEGERVPRGATVRAGRTGAQLVTRGRDVYLGGDTAVTVLDGAHQVLRAGFVLVDAADAPGVELAAPAATVTAADDSLVRVDGGALLRVGVLRGDAADVRAAGRRATTEVDTYYQVQVPTGGLPGVPTPFVLTPGDAYERQLAGDLVSADAELTALASRLDSDGPVGQVVLSSLRAEVGPEPTLPAGAPESERALGYLIAAATPGSAPLAERYDQVRRLRTDGGSWGIVAAIVSAPVERVGAALSALLEPGSVPVLTSGPLGGSLLDLLRPVSGPAGGPGTAGRQGDADRDPGDGGDPPRPTASPTPGPPAGPTEPVTDLVQEVVDTVLDLVSPSPSAPPAPPAPAPLPPAPAPLPVATPTSSPAPALPLPPLPTLPPLL